MTDNASGIHIAIPKPAGSVAAEQFHLALNTVFPGNGITAIFGPSGSGKTTLLRWVAGLHQLPDSHLVINSQCWQKNNFFIPPHQRNLGYVFQEASLFPHLSVERNIRYGLKRRKTELSDKEYQQILQVLDIQCLLSRMPGKLSGGERQRVAIARALVTKPKLLLMDEPLASLDDGLKQQILPYLEQLKQLTDIPILYVTHSLQEVSRLADHLMILQQGKAIAQGTVNEVFSQQHCDNNEYLGTVIDVIATEMDEKWHLTRFSFGDNHLWLANTNEKLQQHCRVRIPASDVSISLTASNDSSILNRLKARIKNIKLCQNQANCLVSLLVSEQPLVAQITQKSASQLQLREGMEVWVQIKSAALIR